MTFLQLLTAALAASALVVPSTAFAHPKLITSNPAANSIVSKPTRLTLTYSEKLVAPLAGVELTMTSMPGMANHKPMKVTGFKVSVAPDGKTLVVALPRALPSGSYELKWHAVGGDTHRIIGALSFKVR